jgi:polyhydroxyalkanoate synthesis regulator phasin
MSMLLSLDLVLLEEKLRSEVEEKFGERTWDKVECDNVYDEIVKNGKMSYSSWNKMMGTGKTPKSRSTRRSLDNKRLHNKIVGDNSYVGIKL